MRSAAFARLVDVATNVIGIDVKVGLADDAFKDVGAGIEGGGIGGSALGTGLEGPQEDRWVQREEAVVADGAGDPQDVVVLPLVY